MNVKKETPTQVISCQFCKIFKNTFLTKHLLWLLFAILKPLDSQRQLCKWIFKLVTIYFTSTFCHFCVYFCQAQLFFYILTRLRLRIYDGFDFSRDYKIEVSRDFLGGTPSSWFSTLSDFGGHGPCECGDKMFWLDT